MNEYKEIINLYKHAELYNREFNNYEDDFSFWEYWIKKIKPKSILEIGIGNGRLINLLSPYVSKYDGLDISKEIIDEYNKNNILKNGQIYNQDMKKINIFNKYDMIIIPFNTYSYLYSFDDIKSFFKSIKRVSKDSTIIIFDIINPSIDDLKNQKKYNLCNEFMINNKKCMVYEKHIFNESKQVITYYKKYKIKLNETILKLPVRIFFPQEIDNIIRNFNYNIIYKLGDYNNEIYHSDSRKQIFIIKGG